MFFERIDAELKKNYKGKKWLELEPEQRNKIADVIQEDIKDVMTFLGAKSMTVYVSDDNSQTAMCEGMGLDESMNLLKSTLRRVSRGLDSSVLKAVTAYNETTSNLPEGIDEEMIKTAFNEAIADLSPSEREKVMNRMDAIMTGKVVPNFIKEKIKGSTNSTDEDSLLDDLLK